MLAELVPAGVAKAAAIFFSVLLARVQREMRRVMGDVQEDRLIAVFLECLVHEMQCVIGEDIRGVPFLVRMQMVHGCLGAG